MSARRRLLISFSGGETSAYMTWRILRYEFHRYSEIVVVFANTGQENEQTLEFIRNCDERFGFGTIWIEAVQYHGERKSAGFRIVDFETADRAGATFEDMILKYGIPNHKFKHCTRSLKRIPIEAYATSLGWSRDSYDTAIGIRADEIDRMSVNHTKGLAYPLVGWGVKKPAVNAWWDRQNFRLMLKGYQGNCRWCWKKSLRKHMTLIGEDPAAYDFPARMESEHGKFGPEFLKDPATRRDPLPATYKRTFFRENRSVQDLISLHAELPATFRPADDDSVIYPDQADMFDDTLDTPGGCGESCEVFSDESEADVEPDEPAHG